jgi:uncharacterized protein (DUF1697 family)
MPSTKWTRWELAIVIGVVCESAPSEQLWYRCNMKTWIALLRGVNVGGKNKLPMKALAAELATIGMSDIRTYIQSGNVIFRSPDAQVATVLAAEIRAAIKAKFGFEPHVIVISAKELADSVANNPFSELSLDSDGKALHFFFLAEAPRNFDQDRLAAVRRQSERWQVEGRILYLHTPQGFGNSKLSSQIERILGVTATARNWSTVCALLNLAKTPC